MATKIIRMLTVTAAATASLVVAMAGAAAVAPAFTYTVHVGSTPPGTLLHMTSYPVGSPPQFRVADTTNGMTLTCTSPPTLSDIIPGQYHSTDTGRLSSPGSLIQAPACDSAVSSARLYITLRITSMSTSPAAFRGVGSNGVFASLRFGDGCTFYLHGACTLCFRYLF